MVKPIIAEIPPDSGGLSLYVPSKQTPLTAEIQTVTIGGGSGAEGLYVDTTENWNAKASLIGEENVVYMYTDHQHNEQGQAVPGFKIGDGQAYLIDLPFNDDLVIAHSTQYLGVTTTELIDNVTTNPSISVAGETVIASAGGIATYGSKEFIYSGTVWQEFGDLSALGSLAYKNSATGSYTPEGSVTVGTSSSKHAVSKASSGTTTYTPEGTVSLSTTATDIELIRGVGTSSNYTVKEASTVTVGTTSTIPTITISEGAANNGYQVKGTVGTPTITVVPNTDTVNSITDVGTIPQLTTSVNNEVLTIGWSAGTLPTKGADQTVATGINSATATQPTFTGGYVKATSSAVTTPTGNSTITYDYTTLTDSVEIPTSASFSGTAVRLETDNVTSPNGTNSFRGTEAIITVS